MTDGSITYEFEEVRLTVDGREVLITGDIDVEYEYWPEEGVVPFFNTSLVITDYCDVETEMSVPCVFKLHQKLACAEDIIEKIYDGVVEACHEDRRDNEYWRD